MISTYSKLLLTALSLIAIAPHASAQDEKAASEPTLELYRLNCGEIHVTNLDVFSDTKQYVGEEKTLTDSCYVIKSGANILLWDTGLPDDIVGQENAGSPPFLLKKETKLADELTKMSLKPEDITHLGISHAHFDHAANVSLFKDAKLIIQKAEYDFMVNQPEEAKAYHMDPENFGEYLKEENKAKVEALTGDKDIFSDGSVIALTLPGHTPGHMGLLVNLKTTGPVLLAGDQWHFHENHENNGVPSFNYDRADTLASSNRLDKMAQNLNAKLVIQHEPKDQKLFPALPNALK
ncbi:MAG: N-acyl homoserine lactonase family protein [Micavibrio sp.]|nr:N-acyl homoserine lactonase family protein [Micavibrio sp.]